MYVSYTSIKVKRDTNQAGKIKLTHGSKTVGEISLPLNRGMSTDALVAEFATLLRTQVVDEIPVTAVDFKDIVTVAIFSENPMLGFTQCAAEGSISCEVMSSHGLFQSPTIPNEATTASLAMLSLQLRERDHSLLHHSILAVSGV